MTRRDVAVGTIGAALGALVVFLVRARPDPQTPRDRVRRSDRTADPIHDPPDAPPPATAEIAKLLGDPAPDATRDDLLVRDAALRRELRRLRGETPGAEAGDPKHEQFVDLGPDELRAMAERCEVRIDYPSLSTDSDQFWIPSDLGADERRAVGDAAGQLHHELAAEVRRLYVDATGDESGAASLSLDAMLREIDEKSAPGDTGAARQSLARERAGLAAPRDPAGSSASERAMRLLASLGDRWESLLADTVGAERAHAMRVSGNGWNHSIMAGCPGG